MDFRVTVRTYTGAVKTVEVTDMPTEEAARAEAVGMTFGQVLSIELIGGQETVSEKKEKRQSRVQRIEKELKPGETETIITGWNNNPLAVFNALNNDEIDMLQTVAQVSTTLTWDTKVPYTIFIPNKHTP